MYCQVSPALSNNLLNMAYLFFLSLNQLKKKKKKKGLFEEMKINAV